MLTEEEYYARLTVEAMMMEKEEPSFKPVDGDLRKWRGFILGTDVYDGGVFVFELTVPRDFPYSPPSIKVRTKIFHPNFSGQQVCVSITGSDWTPSYTLTGVIEVLRTLLHCPNPDSPLNSDAARLLRKSKRKYKAKVQEWVEKYASIEKLQ